MPKLIVQGGKSLKGTIKVSGSKNAALPIICAALLTDEQTTLNNVPNIADIHSLIKILEGLNVKTEFKNNTLTIDPSAIKSSEPPRELVKKMRASILIMGAILPRFKKLKMAFPGGCVLGKRSVSAHTAAFESFGCEILDEQNELNIQCKKIVGKKFILPELSVTATENAIMMAVLAEGKTEIRLAAAEPHVQDLCHFLNKMGAKISQIGTNNLKIEGVKSLHGVEYAVTGDYLEAGTFAIAAVATKGEVEITGIETDQLDSLWQKFDEMGVKFQLSGQSVKIFPTNSIKPIKNLKTAVYPGFPTDLQAPFTVLLSQAEGVSRIFETLFEGRLNYLFELELMGAHVEFLNPHQALVIGPKKLKGCPISSFDIRAGAAMVVASLMAEGKTTISNINYIDRGYEDLHLKLNQLGAKIERVD